MSVIMCSVKKAYELMDHLNEDDMVILTILDKKSHIHSIPKRIKKKNGEMLINRAEDIYYQDNDFFGMLSLYGVLKEKNTIHNISFPQLE